MHAAERRAALDLAVEAATMAGDMLVERGDALLRGDAELAIRTKSSARDFVTQVDKEVQDAIIAMIRERFPDHRFIAEEEGADALGDGGSPFVWIIDPLDGTTNFIHGKPTFGTMLALREGDSLELAVIHMPRLRLLFSGARGVGAFVNGNPVRLRATKNMADAIVCSNMMGRAKPDKDGTLRITTPFCASLENYGNAAQEVGEFLLGWNDGLFFEGTGLWDAAPGCLLAELAGGRSRLEPLDPGDIRKGVRCVMSTAPIFDELSAFVFGKR